MRPLLRLFGMCLVPGLGIRFARLDRRSRLGPGGASNLAARQGGRRSRQLGGAEDEASEDMRRVTANGSLGGKEKIWIAPQLARWMEPLLAGLGIDFDDRADATLRIEASATDCRSGPASARIRIERSGELSAATGYDSDLLAV